MSVFTLEELEAAIEIYPELPPYDDERYTNAERGHGFEDVFSDIITEFTSDDEIRLIAELQARREFRDAGTEAILRPSSLEDMYTDIRDERRDVRWGSYSDIYAKIVEGQTRR